MVVTPLSTNILVAEEDEGVGIIASLGFDQKERGTTRDCRMSRSRHSRERRNKQNGKTPVCQNYKYTAWKLALLTSNIHH
jgi:hypothetical protein